MVRIWNNRFSHYILLLTVTAALTLPGLGSISLWDIDEGLNAEAAREMLESGDWVVPTFNFKPRTAKPALLYWLQALAYQRFGVNEFSARLPSVLAGAISVLLTYELGRRMFGPMTGLLGGAIAISTVQVSVVAHAATPDAILLAGFMLTMLLFWIGAANSRRHWTWLVGVGCGLGVLAKGPIGVVMPAAIIGYYFLAQRQLRRLFDPRLLLGLGVTIAIAGPWYALVGAETRGRFLKTFWQMENVGRFLAPMDGHAGPVYYYPIVLLIGLAPWSVFLWPIVRDTFGSLRSQGDQESDAVRFLVCWIAVFVGFFSLAQTKLPNYVLPAYPPLALLAARYLLRWRAGLAAEARWNMPAALIIFAMIGLGVAIGLTVLGGVLTPAVLANRVIDGLSKWAWVGIIPVIGAAAAAWCLRRGRRAAVVTTFAAAAVAFVGLSSVLPVRAVDAAKACRPLVAAAGADRPTDEIRIANLGYFQPSLVFYCRREVSEIFSPQEALNLLRGPLPAYVFCPAEIGEQLAKAGTYRVTGRHRDFYRGIDVVAVTNQ